MNYNRRRNIFTLGDFQHQHPQQQIKAQLHRRQNSDPFERDPFKIQSYNFRYADRPSYPLQSLVNSNSNSHSHSHSHSHPSAKNFETYFYNYDFAPTRNDKENPPTNKFHEFRRRKFLHEQQQQVPASTNLFGQAANSRQLNVRQQQQQHHYQQSYQAQHQQQPQSLQQQQQQQQLLQQQQRQQQQQQRQQQPLYPLAQASSTANGGTTSGTSTSGLPQRLQSTATAAATATGAAVSAARAAAGGVAQSRGRSPLHAYVHSLQRKSGGGGHTTDASSASTAVGDLSVGTSNLSSLQTSTAPLIRPNSREYLSGVCSPHSSSAQSAALLYGTPHVLRQTRSSSRSSLGIGAAVDGGARQRSDTADGRGSGAGGVYKGGRDVSGPRTSSSEHARRSPLQTLHASHQNMVTPDGGQAQGSYSGCQININIKGLDSKQLGENVTIKIESDNNNINSNSNGNGPNGSKAFRSASPQLDNASTYNDYGADSGKLPIRRSGTQLRQYLQSRNNLTGSADPLNLMQQGSTSTFNIDKRLSKFSLRSHDHEKDRERTRTLERKAHEKQRSVSNTRSGTAPPPTPDYDEASQSKLKLQSPTHTPPTPTTTTTTAKCLQAEERLPSRVPWRLDENLRQCFEHTDKEAAHTRPTNMMRRIRTSYNSAKNDIRNLKSYAAALTAAGPPRPPGVCVKPSPGAAAAGGLPYERKLLNTTAPQRRFECGAKEPKLLAATPLRLQTSHNKLGTNLACKSSTAHSIASSYASELEPRQPLVIQSRQNVKTQPLNVNINVYADKLKLLRV